MKVLHIANDYSGSKVYKNLVSALDENGIAQIIYIPLREFKLVSLHNVDFKVGDSKIIYRKILNTYTRLNYFFKIKKITNDLTSQTNVKEFNLVHAHTWYSDGGVAFNLFNEHQIPYIVTIRNTDINLFFKYFIHLRKRALKILFNAQKIIFISPIYKERLFSHAYLKNHLNMLEDKTEIIPNGIDKFWLNNIRTKKLKLNKEPQLLYIGRFRKSKNVLAIIFSVVYLNKCGVRCCLNLVGDGAGKYCQNVMKLIHKYSDFIKYHGYLDELEPLKQLYRACDLFVMPSKVETLGLVYIEALSQGIPVLYSKGEGIDGIFPAVIGESVNPQIQEDITKKIKKIIHNYDCYNFNALKLVSPFNWDLIAARYHGIYEDCLSISIFK